MIIIYLYLLLNLFFGYLIFLEIKDQFDSVDELIDTARSINSDKLEGLSNKELKVLFFITLGLAGTVVFFYTRKN